MNTIKMKTIDSNLNPNPNLILTLILILILILTTRQMKKNLQKSVFLFGTKSNAYLQINCPIFAYSWLFLPILAYLRICSKSPQIYFAFRAKYPYLFLPIFRYLTCDTSCLIRNYNVSSRR